MLVCNYPQTSQTLSPAGATLGWVTLMRLTMRILCFWRTPPMKTSCASASRCTDSATASSVHLMKMHNRAHLHDATLRDYAAHKQAQLMSSFA